jgi:hypothetical protein
MGPHRKSDRLSSCIRRRQGGMTVIGFLFLAALVGIVGLGGIKVFPLYYTNLRIGRVMDDVRRDLEGTNTTPQAIRSELDRRFVVESVELPRQNVKIARMDDGYQLRITYEGRTSYIGNVWLLVEFDKQVEIRR